MNFQNFSIVVLIFKKNLNHENKQNQWLLLTHIIQGATTCDPMLEIFHGFLPKNDNQAYKSTNNFIPYATLFYSFEK